MVTQMPRNPSHHEVLEKAPGMCTHEEFVSFKPKWYFTTEEIDQHSPSRKDGIDLQQESHLRHLYCSYLQELGIELKVPQVTIATAMMLCHRFYMHQSHSKNHWQAIANSAMFLACKAEDTPRWLKELIVVTYKLTYKWDPLAPHKIRQKEVYDKQKDLILLGEQIILVTVAFDFNIEHPYKPLVAALKRLEISQKEVVKVAWNFVNDWLHTTMCLQYKPHYVAAGSVYLAAKLQKIKLPSGNGNAWWMQFDVTPKRLEEVIQHMLRILGKSSKQAFPATPEARTEPKPVSVKRKLDSSESFPQNVPTVKQDSPKTATVSESTVLKCHKEPTTEKSLSDSGSANSVVEDGDGELKTGDSIQKPGCNIVSVKGSCQKIDITSIKERLKRRKLDRLENKKTSDNVEDEKNGEDWIIRELENGIESVSALS